MNAKKAKKAEPVLAVSQLLSVARAAEVLDCSPTHVYRLIAAGRLRAVEIKVYGRRPKTRIRAADLEEFIDAQTRVADPRSPRAH